MSVRGVDVSHYQARTPNLAGASFLIAKAVEGTTPDPTFAMHIGNARRAGLAVAAFAFGRNSDVGAQVAAFLERIRSVDVRAVALDVERPNDGGPTMTHNQEQAWIAAVQAAGYRVGRYGSESVFWDAGQDWDWVANYSREPARHYDVWQYGPFEPGVDGDTFRGTVPDLLELWGVTMTPAPITDETPKVITTAAGTSWYDVDGKTIVSAGAGHAALAPRPSPYGVGAKRAIYANVPDAAHRRIVLVTPATSVGIPAPDCKPAVTAALDAAATRAAAAVRAGP